MRKLFYGMIVMVGMSLIGCSGADIKDIAPKMPEAKLTETAMTSFSFDRADLTLKFDVDNPNFFPLSLAGLRYNFKVNDSSLVAGGSNAPMTLDANGVSSIDVPLSFEFDQLINAVSSLSKENAFNYAIETEIDVSAPLLGVITLPVSATGQLPIPQMPKINNASVAIQKVTLAGAQLSLAFDIENPNIFNVLLNELDYQFAVSGKTWARMKVDNEMTINKNKATRISLPVVMDFAAIGSSGFSLLQAGDSFDFDLSGNMNILPEWPGFAPEDVPFSLSGR